MTQQQKDTLSHNSLVYTVSRNVFKGFFQSHPSLKPKNHGFESDLLRGYFASFEIVESQLLIADVRINVGFDESSGALNSRSVLNEVFPLSRVCDWFSGELILFPVSPKGNQLTCLKVTFSKGELLDEVFLSQMEYEQLDLSKHHYY